MATKPFADVEVAQSGARAAAYLRMSTDRQNYSLRHQRALIDEYALRHGLSIVRVYEDRGKSGLRVEGRCGLRTLLDEVSSGSAEFDFVLVYDVSRWGRFQDADESAYYEFMCRRAGIRVIYCAEPFSTDDSPMAAILKSLKRMMAGEYSRELSAKVFNAQSNFTLMGFKQGGAAGYGLRRIAVDIAGRPRAELRAGERKIAQTDRVVLGIGPADEVHVVESIYDMYLLRGLGDKRIAAVLNAAGVTGELGRAWTKNTVNTVLTNDKYAGHAVYNRTSFKLKKREISNPPGMWIRKEGAFPALIDADVFDKAQTERARRHRRYTDAELLDILREVHAEHGKISARLISNRAPSPTPQAFKHHFGTLGNAYALAGLDAPEAFSYVESRRAMRKIRTHLVADVVTLIGAAGGTSEPSTGKDLYRVNDQIVLKIAVARCQKESTGNRWRFRSKLAIGADFAIIAKLATDNRSIMEFYLLRMSDHCGDWVALPSNSGASHLLSRQCYAELADMFRPRC